MNRAVAWRVARQAVSLSWGLLAAWSAGAATAQPAEVESTRLRCEPVYMPARSVWVREVSLLARDGQLREVRIDGARVYTFTVRDGVIFTSQDNERIQIDLNARTWRGDFRGLASGQGRCEPEAH